MIVYACGKITTSGYIFKSTDGGVNYTWQKTTTGTNHYSIYFVTSQLGWVAGSNGKIYKTTNGGTNWNPQTSNVSATLYSIKFFDANNGLAAGSGGVVIKTTNGGTTWTAATRVTEQQLNSIALIDESTSLVAGNSSVLIKSYNAPLPVELTSFTARVSGNTVTLNWETKTEIDNYGFEIERKTATSTWDKIGFVEGHSTTNSPKYYNFTDSPRGNGKFQYRLKQIDNDGAFEYSSVVEVDFSGLLPREIEIKNFPNPFNPETNINIRVPEDADTRVEVYGPLGEHVVTLFAGKLYSGDTRAFMFDGSDRSSGMYIIHVTAGKHRKTHKVLLMK